MNKKIKTNFSLALLLLTIINYQATYAGDFDKNEKSKPLQPIQEFYPRNLESLFSQDYKNFHTKNNNKAYHSPSQNGGNRTIRIDPEEWIRIKKIIEELDKPQPQIALSDHK